MSLKSTTPIELPANPTNNLEAATKQYVDGRTPDRVLFMGQANANQTLTNGNNWTDILLQLESVDTHNGHSTVSNTDRYVIPVTGRYLIQYNAFFNVGNTNGVKAAQLSVNGSTLAGTSFWQHYSTNSFLSVVGYWAGSLTSGDIVRLQANGNGTSQTLFGQTTDGSTMLVQSMF